MLFIGGVRSRDLASNIGIQILPAILKQSYIHTLNVNFITSFLSNEAFA